MVVTFVTRQSDFQGKNVHSAAITLPLFIYSCFHMLQYILCASDHCGIKSKHIKSMHKATNCTPTD